MTEKKSTKFRPMRDNILVLRDEAESKSEGGIIMPEGSVKPPARGTVRAVGPGLHTESGVLIPMALNPGDRVVFGAHAGHDVEVDHVSYVVIRSIDVLGVV